MASVKDKKESEVDLFWSFINGKNEEKKDEKSETQIKETDTRQTEEKQSQLESSKEEEIISKSEINHEPKTAEDSGRSNALTLEKVLQKLEELEAFDVKDESDEDSEMGMFFENEKKKRTLNGDIQGLITPDLKAVQKLIQDKVKEPSVEEQENLELQRSPELAEKKEEENEESELFGFDRIFASVLGDYYRPVVQVMVMVTSIFGIFTICHFYSAVELFKSIPHSPN